MGYRQDREVCRDTMRTAGAPARLSLTTDRTCLAADGQDVACVTVAVLDTDGTPVPDARIPVRFEVEGPGRLLGCGNGDPCDHTLDASPVRRTLGGLCLAIVQAGTREGDVRLQAAAEGMPTISIALRTVKRET